MASTGFEPKTSAMPVHPVLLGGSLVKTRLLGLTVDHKLTWIPHVLQTKTFATKLDFLKRTRFSPTKVRREFYFKLILLSVEYGLVLWGACRNLWNVYPVEKQELSATCLLCF